MSTNPLDDTDVLERFSAFMVRERPDNPIDVKELAVCAILLSWLRIKQTIRNSQVCTPCAPGADMHCPDADCEGSMVRRYDHNDFICQSCGSVAPF